MFPFFKTFTSLSEARLLGILLFCALLAVVVAVSFSFGIGWLINLLSYWDTNWINTLVGWATGVLSGVLFWFMLPTLVVLISGVFQETIISRVEKIYYPDFQRTTSPKIWPDLVHDLRFTLRAIFLNLLIVPFYFFGIGFFLSIALNSYLLGREFFEAAAGYHFGKKKAQVVGNRFRGPVYTGGLMITLATLVPVLNMAVPVLAVVWMTHLFHFLRDKEKSKTAFT